MKNLLDDFKSTLNENYNILNNIPPTEFALKISVEKWSKKEILGHLIDSCMINYQRFIKAQFEENPHIFYDQNKYCEAALYQFSENQQLINLWYFNNKQLLFLIENLNAEQLNKLCNDVTLEFLAIDYVNHLKHHLSQIIP